jgi:hypothetical protein
MNELDINWDAPNWSSFTEFLHLWTILTNDVRVLDRSDAADEQVFRRSYVRAVLAYVEGVVSGIKRQALANPLVPLTAAEGALLREEIFELDSRGKSRARQAFLKLELNVRFAFSTYAKAAGAEYTLPTDEAGWGFLIEAIRVRNRLAHPKSLGDLEVTELEKDRVRNAFDWFGAKHREMLKELMIAAFRRDGMSDTEIRRAIDGAPFSF